MRQTDGQTDEAQGHTVGSMKTMLDTSSNSPAPPLMLDAQHLQGLPRYSQSTAARGILSRWHSCDFGQAAAIRVRKSVTIVKQNIGFEVMHTPTTTDNTAPGARLIDAKPSTRSAGLMGSYGLGGCCSGCIGRCVSPNHRVKPLEMGTAIFHQFNIVRRISSCVLHHPRGFKPSM